MPVGASWGFSHGQLHVLNAARAQPLSTSLVLRSGTAVTMSGIGAPRYEVYHRWRLINDAKQLAAITRRRRHQLWGDYKLQYRVKYTPKSKEERPTLVMPQMHNVKLYSEALDKSFNLRVTSKALRSTDRLGGLDNFLLATPENKLFSDVGSRIKLQIQVQKVKLEYQEFLQHKKEVEQERLKRMVAMLEPHTAHESIK